jgi:hypothetical protein
VRRQASSSRCGSHARIERTRRAETILFCVACVFVMTGGFARQVRAQELGSPTNDPQAISDSALSWADQADFGTVQMTPCHRCRRACLRRSLRCGWLPKRKLPAPAFRRLKAPSRSKTRMHPPGRNASWRWRNRGSLLAPARSADTPFLDHGRRDHGTQSRAQPPELPHPGPEGFDISLDSWWDNLKEGWEFDPNAFSRISSRTRTIGGIYFTAARSNGYDYWQSIPFAALGSLHRGSTSVRPTARR